MAQEIDIKLLRRYSHLELISRQVVEGFITGLHKSPFHGFSVEFAEHRIYNQGESTRHIDWKLFARSDKLFVKKYEEETNLRCRIVIDTSSSMLYPVNQEASFENPNKLVFSVYAAASIIQMLKKQRDAFGLSVFNEQIEFNSPAKSSNVHQKYVFGELEKILSIKADDNKKKTAAIDTLHQIAEQINRRSLVVIFSDMFDDISRKDDLFDALQHLRHNKHEVILFHVLDKKSEIDFEFQNRPYRFIDLESNQELKLHPNEVKELYVKAMKEYFEELKMKCGQFQIDYVEADINKGFHQILMPYFIKRKKML
ncbi:MAG: DUF58 domain-containing protein [Bacteroidales bacterium]|nr:DUF58 domain-containing protein [Bacteroidales bacterium]MDY0217299.1 DUF58 domain-containing protein [Bacteroidales bacterium]